MHVAVIGAGWSGLAAAVELLDAGAGVTLIDAAPQVGGRARRVAVTLGDRTYSLDNGQHLLIGAYRDYLALARRLGVPVDATFRIEPFDLRYPDGVTIVAARAPAPWHLAGAIVFARGLTLREKCGAALWVQAWKRRGWSVDTDRPAAELFAGHPPRLVERLWAPLCLAAMNVRLEAASARVFMRILRDTLGAAAEASHLLLPRGDASALFPDAAERALRAAGAEIRLRDAALALARIDPARWRVILRSNSLDVDRVILALPPARSAALLSSTGHADVRTATEQLTRIESAPIATVYLRYAPTTRLDRPLFALREQPSTGDYGQWVFDRGLLEESNAGVLSVVVSGAGPHTELTQEELAQAVARQLSRSFALPPPLAHAVLTEKRATIAPGPGLVRPPVRLPLPFLYLASDAAENPYPSTLEGAVRAGRAAARAAIEDTALSAA